MIVIYLIAILFLLNQRYKQVNCLSWVLILILLYVESSAAFTVFYTTGDNVGPFGVL